MVSNNYVLNKQVISRLGEIHKLLQMDPIPTPWNWFYTFSVNITPTASKFTCCHI